MGEFDLTRMDVVDGQGLSAASSAASEILVRAGQQREFPNVADAGDKAAAIGDGSGFRGISNELVGLSSAGENIRCAATLIEMSQQQVEARLSSVQAV